MTLPKIKQECETRLMICYICNIYIEKVRLCWCLNKKRLKPSGRLCYWFLFYLPKLQTETNLGKDLSLQRKSENMVKHWASILKKKVNLVYILDSFDLKLLRVITVSLLNFLFMQIWGRIHGVLSIDNIFVYRWLFALSLRCFFFGNIT